MAFTFFFRDPATLELIASDVIPALIGRRCIRIWDAGCATGQEPYSLAIILREAVGVFTFRRISILATDLDPTGQFGPIVREGVYANEQVARVPEAMRRRHFQPVDGGHVQVVDEVRSRVTFQRHDLLSLEPPIRGADVIVCKNVLLHLSEQQRCDVISMFYTSLSPGGCLAIEQTQAMPNTVEALFRPRSDRMHLFTKRTPSGCCQPDPIRTHQRPPCLNQKKHAGSETDDAAVVTSER